MANVAITRARGKLIVLADRSWCERCKLDQVNPLLGSIILGSSPDAHVRVLSAKPLPVSKSPNRAKRQSDWQPVNGGSESPIEERLWQALQRVPLLAAMIRQQIAINDETGQIITRADFAFPEIKYAIYCDGRQWHVVENRWQSDLRKRNKLPQLGWVFSVYSGAEINRSADECVADILKTFLVQYRTRLAPAWEMTIAELKTAVELLRYFNDTSSVDDLCSQYRTRLRKSWEMTRAEWRDAVAVLKLFDDQEGLVSIGGLNASVNDSAHRRRIEVRLNDGHKVSERVLADYPDLVLKSNPSEN